MRNHRIFGVDQRPAMPYDEVGFDEPEFGRVPLSQGFYEQLKTTKLMRNAVPCVKVRRIE